MLFRYIVSFKTTMRIPRFLFALFVIAFALPLSGCGNMSITESSQDGTKDRFLDIQEIRTKSGITAWLVEDHSLPIIAMDYSFQGAGAKNDPEGKQGLAQLASNTMDEGAGDLDAQSFQEMLQNHSVSLSFHSGRDHFGGSLKTLREHKNIAFDLLKLALTQPRFDEEAVDRMRLANQTRIRSSVSNPRWIAARITNDRLFEGHPYARNSGGTLSSLDAITTDDLRAFHKGLGKNQLVIGVAGDITAKELEQHLNSVFGSLPVVKRKKTDLKALSNLGESYVYKKNIPQTVISVSQPGISRQDEDFYSAYLMNFILGGSGFGSRLMEEIREKRGLTYGIYSYFLDYDETDLLQVSTSTESANVPEMLSLIRDEWRKMIETPVSQEELEQAKSYVIGSLPLSFTSTDSISGVLLSLQLDELPIDYLDQRAANINAVTIKDIKSVSERLLDVEQLTTVMVGQPAGARGDLTGGMSDVNVIDTLPNVE